MDKYLPIQNLAREDFIINGFTLIPMEDVGDFSRNVWSNYLFPSLHPAAAISPPIMALMILLIACFNFANTTIAATGRRLKEIGIRKTFGGFRQQLIVQFFLETILICIMATLAGLAIASFLVPAYSSLWPYMTLYMTLSGHWGFILFLVLLLLLTGFLSGVYPAFYISSLKPVDILRSRSKYGKTGMVSNILLSLQFTISIMALVMGIVFLQNSKYQDTIDLGYDRDQLIIVPINSDFYNQYHESVIDNPLIISVAGTQEHIGYGSYRRPVEDENKQIEVDVLDTGPEYASTMGLRLIEGRLFDPLRADADKHESIIINEQLLSDFGWDEAIGKTITLYDTTRLTVIGVVEDYYNNGLWSKIEPSFIRLSNEEIYYNLIVRASTENLPEVLEYLRETWQSLFPSYIFTGIYQEDTLKEGKDINDSIMKVNLFLAIVATFLSLIGIYSLVSLSVLHRTKEIGIRNVIGSSVGNVIMLLSKRFIIILVIASIVGCVAGYYLSAMLLDSIWDYFLDITISMLLFSVFIMFVMTAITITGKTYKAATSNPVKALQTE
jgi:ABC-type antimicrobial peptide transport system permease subunit